jgi:adenylosuccinate lyase
MREHGRTDNDLLARLAQDPRLRLEPAEVERLSAHPLDFVGNAGAQTRAFVEQVTALVARHPEAGAYAPGTLL